MRRTAGMGTGSATASAERQDKPAEKLTTDDAHFPRRFLHREDGPAVQPHRRFTARLPVLEPERSAADALRRHRMDVPRVVQHAGSARLRREGARRRDGKGLRRAREGCSSGQRIDFPRESQRGHRAGNASVSVEGRIVRGSGRAVRRRRQEIQSRIVHREERVGRRHAEGGSRPRPADRRPRTRRHR